MARFDVYKLKIQAPFLVLDVQADILNELGTRVVIPLIEKISNHDPVIKNLNPIIAIDNKDYVLMTSDITVLKKETLGKKITNLEEGHRLEITQALDFVFQGF